MLRIVALILLLANGGYYAWSHGMFGTLGPIKEGEPERLEQQIHPEYLQIVLNATELQTPSSVKPEPTEEPLAAELPELPSIAPTDVSEATNTVTDTAPPPLTTEVTVNNVSTPRPSSGICLHAGIFDSMQVDTLRTALAAWPQGTWHLEATPISGRWMVYLGPLDNEKAVAQKRSELRSKGIDFDRPGAALEPGLSLGRYSSQDGAHRARNELQERGINNLRIVVDRPPGQGFTLRLPAVDDELRVRVRALRPILGNKTLRPC